MKRLFYIIILMLPWAALAQGGKTQSEHHDAGSLLSPLQPRLEQLAARAAEVVDVTLDSSMLQFATKFMDNKDADDAQAKALITGLKGIYVRSFEFSKPGEYTEQDVESLRAQLKPPVWSRVVGVRSKKQGENADVFFKMDNGKVMGLAIIAAEPLELTFVHIDGPIDPDKLGDLTGHFGVPKVEMPKSKPPKTPAKSEVK